MTKELNELRDKFKAVCEERDQAVSHSAELQFSVVYLQEQLNAARNKVRIAAIKLNKVPKLAYDKLLIIIVFKVMDMQISGT
jgi:hypothetical protein